MSNFFSPIVCNMHMHSFAYQKVRTELAAVYLCCRMAEDADQLDLECCEGGVGGR
jgi:hypothetical protein